MRAYLSNQTARSDFSFHAWGYAQVACESELEDMAHASRAIAEATRILADVEHDTTPWHPGWITPSIYGVAWPATHKDARSSLAESLSAILPEFDRLAEQAKREAR
jgi:hypothetical protein